MRGRDDLDETVQDIAVVLHEHFRPDGIVSSSSISACSEVHDEIRVGLALKASLKKCGEGRNVCLIEQLHADTFRERKRACTRQRVNIDKRPGAEGYRRGGSHVRTIAMLWLTCVPSNSMCGSWGGAKLRPATEVATPNK